MYTLTDNRRREALPILEKYRAHMESSGKIDSHGFERELRECWDTGYQEIKDIVLQLSKEPKYERMAAYYMQFSGTPGVVSEFQPRLAQLYGVTYFDSAETAAKRDAYWAA